MAMKTKTPLGVELVKRGVVTEDAIAKAIEYQKEHPNKKLGDILNILNLCKQTELISAMGSILGEKVILLSIDSVKIDPKQYVALDVQKSCRAVMFDIEGKVAKVCFADTANKKAIEQIRLLLLSKNMVMEKYLSFETNVIKVLKELEGKAASEIQSETDDITSLVDTIMKSAMEKRTSDIHIEPMETSIRVRYRIDGDLITVANIEKSKQAQLVGRLKAISNMHQEKQENQDGRILLYDDYNIRSSSQKTINGEKFCLRLLKKNAGIKNIFDLGFPNDDGILHKCFDKKNSITVVAAPTGEGKTTTLYSILDYLNKPEINITTVEDPVEIRVAGINQIEVDAKQSFADALRTILRQDPDVILLGEIRDKETAEIALQAGQTGHYVLSTVHTINAVEVITRFRKIGISDFDISSTLATAISQRLIRTVCPKCAEKRPFKKEEIEIIHKLLSKYGDVPDFKGKFTYEPKGCKECNYTGFKGRLGAFEILELTEDIKAAISEGESSLKVRDIALKEGYRPLHIDALKKVIDGKFILDEVNKKLAIY